MSGALAMVVVMAGCSAPLTARPNDPLGRTFNDLPKMDNNFAMARDFENQNHWDLAEAKYFDGRNDAIRAKVLLQDDIKTTSDANERVLNALTMLEAYVQYGDHMWKCALDGNMGQTTDYACPEHRSQAQQNLTLAQGIRPTLMA